MLSARSTSTSATMNSTEGSWSISSTGGKTGEVRACWMAALAALFLARCLAEGLVLLLVTGAYGLVTKLTGMAGVGVSLPSFEAISTGVASLLGCTTTFGIGLSGLTGVGRRLVGLRFSTLAS